ncbi:MAG: hypothetical protein AAB920_00725 [Patescibacteria group bacterium]
MGGALVHNKNKIRRRAEEKRAWEVHERGEARRKARKPRKSIVVGRIPEDFLCKLYIDEKKSMREIAKICSCSIHKVAYWITAYSIPIRNQSDATYYAKNAGGDPFSVNLKNMDITNNIFLYGVGLGLYLGIGSKAGNSVRIGNDDSRIILSFIKFLHFAYGVQKDSLHFGLRISDDININSALSFWTNTLDVSRAQFQKPVITTSRKRSNYKYIDKHGFVTLYFNNSKLKRIIMNAIKNC